MTIFTALFKGEDKIMLNGGRAFPTLSKPGKITYQYLNDDGTIVDTSSGSWTVQVRIEQMYVTDQPSGLAAGAVSFVQGDGSLSTHSIASYTFTAVDFTTVGKFRMTIWSGNTIDRLPSAVFYYEVVANTGIDPSN